MRIRDRVGLNITPLFLRLLLAVVFIWAGLVKLSISSPVKGEDAAILANLGIISAPGAAPPETPAAPDPEAPSAPKSEAAAPAIILAQQPAPTYTAANFPDEVQVRLLHQLSLLLYRAAHPEAGKMPLWPQAIGEGHWPGYLAWAVTLTELGGGALVVLGLFTRLSALALGGVMIGAMWLTAIGPAVQKGDTILGFLPNLSAVDPAWSHLQLQFVLFLAALALAFCGPGRASLDHAILGGSHDEDDDDDE